MRFFSAPLSCFIHEILICVIYSLLLLFLIYFSVHTTKIIIYSNKITRSRHGSIPSTRNSSILVSNATFNISNIRYLRSKKIFHGIHRRMFPGRDGGNITTKFIVIRGILSLSTWQYGIQFDLCGFGIGIVYDIDIL